MTDHERTGVVIIAFYPPDELETRLKTWGATTVVVVDNTPVEHARASGWFLSAGATAVIQNGTNRGVGAALNQGLQYLAGLGLVWALICDQDSVIGPAYLNGITESVDAFGEPIGIVGGLPSLGQRQRGRYLRNAHKWAEVINSGSLLSIRAWQAVGYYDEHLFVDLVDFEFSRRLSKRGFGVYLDPNLLFEHHFGEPNPFRVLGRALFLSRYNPSRYYYRIRNAVYVLVHKSRTHGFAWGMHRFLIALRLLVGLPFLAFGNTAYISAAVAGIFHGLAGRLGPVATSGVQKED